MVPKVMHAAMIEGVQKISYKDIPTPSHGDDEVLVKVHSFGICGTDLEIYHGVLSYITKGLASFPIIPGHEWSGEIVACGSQVRGFSVGDHVVGETTLPCHKCAYCRKGQYNVCPNRRETGILNKDGAAADYMAFPAGSLHKVSPKLTLEEACIIEPTAVAYYGLSKVRITPDDQVLVLGAGPVGLLSVQVAKLYGAKKVTLVDIRDNRLKIGKELGADQVVNTSKESLTDTIDPKDGLFTTVVEATGNPIAIENMLDVVDIGARVCMLGICGGKKASLDIDKIVTSEMQLIGALSSPGVWDTVVDLVESKKIRVKPLISHRFALDQLSDAFQLMEKRDPNIVKIVINHN